MKATTTDTGLGTNQVTKPAKTKDDCLSPDGKWRSFPRTANLVQYVNTGIYFGRVKIEGKIFRESLETDVFTTAKLLLGDWIKKKRKKAAHPIAGTFGEARSLYETDLNADHTLKEGSKHYRRHSIKALLRTWPELDTMRPDKVTEAECRAWAARFAKEYDEQFFNNTLSTLRHILERAGIGHDDNPALKVKRLGVKPKELHLPEPEQFEAIVKAIETAGARQSKDCANLVRFLAFSGCRISEAQQVLWQDVDLERGQIRIHNAKRRKTTSAHDLRYVPIISAMRQLLKKLHDDEKPKLTDCVCKVHECEKALTWACGMKNGERLHRKKRGKLIPAGIGVERITHHDLRHLFATRCIESGVDIPTVSRWLGHSDGGGLAMKTYGHLRREHSAAMAQKVTFGSMAAANHN